MPRPLSVTLTKPFASISTSIQSAWPASASSMAVVDDFGKQVMQRLFIGATDIHTGAAADRLEPFQHLDVFGGVTGFCA